MRLRKPRASPPAIKPAAQAGAKLFRVELITPLYGGGVVAGQPDEAMPIRAASIRGQLRFWWRLLNRPFCQSSAELFQKEIAIWGGITAKGAVASRVVVEVLEVNRQGKQTQRCAEFLQGHQNCLALGYAMFSGLQNDSPDKVLAAGVRFKLTVHIRNGAGKTTAAIWNEDIIPALRWWASFGGLGARTRRGLGSVKVTGEGNPQTSITPVSEEEAKKAGCRLVPYPHPLPNRHEAVEAWNKAMAKLQAFRQWPKGRSGPSPRNPGRSYWPEADSIREITGCHLPAHAPVHPAKQSFPRAAFGLPIITQFKDGPRPNTRLTPAQRLRIDPDQTTLVPVINGIVQDRLASPLILKAMWNGTNYTPIALLLPLNHLNGMALQLKDNADHRNPNLPVDIASPAWWPASARSAMVKGMPSPNPLESRTGDVLTDFLVFFTERD